MAFASDILFSIDTALQQKGLVNSELITTNKTLVYSDSSIQLLRNNTGSLDVILPAVKDGVYFWVKSKSSSSSNILVKDPDGGTLATLAAGNGVLVVSDGSAWWDVITG
jgi:hypothetical protein